MDARVECSQFARVIAFVILFLSPSSTHPFLGSPAVLTAANCDVPRIECRCEEPADKRRAGLALCLVWRTRGAYVNVTHTPKIAVLRNNELRCWRYLCYRLPLPQERSTETFKMKCTTFTAVVLLLGEFSGLIVWSSSSSS